MSKRRTESLLVTAMTAALALSSTSCLYQPNDESTIATKSTAVSFSGFFPATAGGPNPDLTFYLYAKNDGATQQIPGYSATTSGSGVNYGQYTWYGVDFGNVVVPDWAWAWDASVAQWHAEVRARTAPGFGMWLYTFTSAELECFVEEIDANENVVTAASTCGGDDVVDLYASGP